MQLALGKGDGVRAECRADDVMANAVVASVEGLFDESGAATLWEAATPRLDRSTPYLLVDLSGVTRITSAGIGALVRLLHRSQGLGGGLGLFGAGARVREVIEAVRLEQILNLGTSIADARASLGGR